MKGTTRAFAAAVYLVAATATWAQSALSPQVQSTLQRNVFEVVIGKPKKDPLTYQKPLPLNLLPYSERTDTQYSIGTAFAIGGGRFISAAHVFALASPTLFGAIALRDSSGTVYPVGEVLAYSTRRDYTVFTVPGLKAQGLSLSENYRLNEAVYSVGNALGQGVVIRDGVLTSLTPEERSGAWKWLRFSAAASPGNSGGPLVDDSGKVIGIVDMKSQNENLNYALPVSQVSFRPIAVLDIRGDYGLPNLTQTAPLEGKQTFHLPLPVDQLRSKMSAAVAAMSKKAAQTLASGHIVQLFPRSPGSAPVLGDTSFTAFPEVIGQNADNTWRIQGIDNPSTSQIGADGSLSFGDQWRYTFFSFVKPSNTTLVQLFQDPRRLMDLILQGYPVTRTIASQDIRITSYGKPAYTENFSDSHGRRWLAARWDIPFADLSELLLALPTPDGAVGYMVQCDYAQWKENLFDMRFLANFVFVSYEGTFHQWKTFLAAPELRPALFDSLHLKYSPNSSFLLDTPRLSFTYTPSVMPISDQSEMAVAPAYYRDGGRVVWAIARVIITATQSGRSYLAFDKTFRPGRSASDAQKRTWANLSRGAYPFDETPFWGNGTTHIDGTAAMGQNGDRTVSTRFLYGLRLGIAGNLTNDAAHTKYDLFKDGLHLKPAEVARATGSETSPPTGSLSTEDGKTIFQAESTNDGAAFRAFLAAKKDLGAVNDDGRTPLMVALQLGRTQMARELLKEGVAVNGVDHSGKTPLILALKHDGYNTARLLLDKGADPNVHDVHNVTPLMLAMPDKFHNLADDLIARGVDINAVTSDHRSALTDALVNGRDGIANELVQRGVRLDLTDEEGWTLLMSALRYCSSDTAQLLIGQGAPEGGKNRDGWTALDFALRYGHNDIALELVRSSDGGVNAATRKDNVTPLMFAAAYGTPEIVRGLLDRGANPSVTDAYGWSPLMDAINHHHSGIARLLVEKMTSLPGRNDNGLNALDLAIVHGDDAVASALLRLSTPLQINLGTSKGVTALDFAAQHATPQLLETLIDKGAKLHVQDSNGWTALMYALRYGSDQNSWAIISHLRSAPERNHDGWNALHFAARYKPGYVPDLVELGLPVNGKTNAGWTPLQLAAYAGHLEAVKWLVANGADPSLTNNAGARAIDIARNKQKTKVVAYLASLES